MPQECLLLPSDAKGEPMSLTELCVSEGMWNECPALVKETNWTYKMSP